MSAPTEGRDVRAVLEGLAAVDGVRGALLVAPDGLVIASHLPSDIGVEALSALAATLGRELELRSSLPGHGPFMTARFAAETGTMIVATTAIGFVVVLADDRVVAARLDEDVQAAVGRIERSWREPALR